MTNSRAGFCGQWPNLKAALLDLSVGTGLWRFSPIFLLALLLSPVTGVMDVGVANAQIFQTNAQREKQSRKRVRRRGRARTITRTRVASKQKKSFLGTLFGSKPSSGNSAKPFQGLKSLFDGFQGIAQPTSSPASLRAAYAKKMREAAARDAMSAMGHLQLRSDRSWGAAPTRAGPAAHSRWGRGQYRTMCVRMCDGYYFPVSFKARSNQLEADAQFCNSDCYNAPTKLFYYSNPGGSIKNMRALDGLLYKDIANAFKYRKEYVADCRCKAEPWSRQARQQHKSWGLEAGIRHDEAQKSINDSLNNPMGEVDMSSASTAATGRSHAEY